MPSETDFRRHGRKLLRGKRLEQQGFAALHNFFKQVDIGMLAGMGARVGNVFGKPYQTLFCRFFVQFSVKTFCQSIVQLERTELTLNGGNVVNRFAVGILNVQTAQMVD